jgi:hypothetical protein
MIQHVAGEPVERIAMGAPDIDTAREPGMSDEQLREKIVRQLRAKGMDAEVTVLGDKVQIRAQMEKKDER